MQFILPFRKIAKEIRSEGWIRKHGLSIAILLVLAVSFFIHFRNLSGAIGLDEDEARAFRLMESGPLIYLLCNPLYKLFGREQSVVFYCVACLGWLSVVLMYFIGRIIGGKRFALYTILFYAFLPLRVDFARSLYPAAFTEFCFLLAILLIFVGIKKQSPYFFSAAGLCCASLLFIHPFGYSHIAGLTVAMLWLLWVSFSQERKKVFLHVSFFVIGGVLGSFFFNYLIMHSPKGFNYLMNLFNFGHTETKYSFVMNDMYTFFYGMFLKATSSCAATMTSLVMIVAFLFMAIGVIKNKNRYLVFYIVFSFVAMALLILFASLGKHPLLERHCVWLGSLCAFSCAFTFTSFIDTTRGYGKAAWKIAVVVVVALLLRGSYIITEETFSINTFRAWFQKNNIPYHEVVTSWWQMNRYTDKDIVTEVPIRILIANTFKDPDMWYSNEQRFFVDWQLIAIACKLEKIKYIMTSGVSVRASLGEDDPFLMRVKPLVTWVHPYSQGRHRYYYNDANFFVKVYRLDDIFQKENLAFVKRLKPR